MGIFGRNAMPLLSTLAALVIIVHSLEYGFFDPALDMEVNSKDGAKKFEKHWTPGINGRYYSAEDWFTNKWNKTGFEYPSQRRKRRPNRTDVNTFWGLSLEDTDEKPKQFHADRSSEDNRDYMDVPPENKMPRSNKHRAKPRRRHGRGHYKRDAERQAEEYVPTRAQHWSELHTPNANKYRFQLRDLEFATEGTSATRAEEVEHISLDRRPLSEFSMYTPLETATDTEKYSKDSFQEQLMSNGPVKPATLKDILKKSNGTSLSEILQQHNLSLSDLLYGKENSASVLQVADSINQTPAANAEKSEETLIMNQNDQKNLDRKDSFQIDIEESTTDAVTESINGDSIIDDDTDGNLREKNITTQTSKDDSKPNALNSKGNSPKILMKRPFSGGPRRKLRMRTRGNNTFKSPLFRDTGIVSGQLPFNSRNLVKGREWKHVLSLMNNTAEKFNASDDTLLTTSTEPIDTTTLLMTTTEVSILPDESQHENKPQELSTDATTSVDPEITTVLIETTTEKIEIVTTEKYKSTPFVRPPVNNSSMRRQAFNNRLKRKRLKQKNSSTEATHDDATNDLLGMTNSVSASEFVAKIQNPQTEIEKNTSNTDEISYTTQKSRKIDDRKKGLRTNRSSTTAKPRPPPLTEESAKVEIEEFLNDTRTSARLSKILMERNMTLSELVEHRERGSSHVHLADIFHNTSREPNPPEPFLSKSLIEPISKETYPLRALLEANLHDPGVKATTLEPITGQANFVNIPIVMDFGNNVNENGENMGIISLFKNFTKTNQTMDSFTVNKDYVRIPYQPSIRTEHKTDVRDSREGRVLSDSQDMVTWTDIFNMLHDKENDTKVPEPSENVVISSQSNRFTMDEYDGDGEIDEFQQINDMDSADKPRFNGHFEVNLINNDVKSHNSEIPQNFTSNMKSVTVATASIVGLAMVLFLLTFAAFKWAQQKKTFRKGCKFQEDRVPTPVFEDRKAPKNSSTRSISPMLSTSNIYTMTTIDPYNSKESPDYTWDTLRKPFQ